MNLFNIVFWSFTLCYFITLGFLYKLSDFKFTLDTFLCTLVISASYYIAYSFSIEYTVLALISSLIFCIYQFYLCKKGSY